MKKIGIILLGGTIASIVTENGYRVISLADFCRQFKELEAFQIVVDEFRHLAGRETKIEDMVEIAAEVRRLSEEEGLDGVVVVQGTNVMEEVAFALDILLHQLEIPVICTGAMRPATAPSADGAGNIIDSVWAAASDQCRGLGVLVVFNGEIHSAQYVRKEHTLNTNAFRSEFMLGYMTEHIPSLRCYPIRRRMPEFHIAPGAKAPNVILYTTYAGDDGSVLDLLERADCHGLVLEGTGAGGMPDWIADRFLRINQKIPCVLASRIGHGDIVFHTYGYGLQQKAYEQGVYLADILDSRKARILLALLLMSGYDRKEIGECFAQYSKNIVLLQP